MNSQVVRDDLYSEEIAAEVPSNLGGAPKRVVDAATSALAILFVSPLFLFIALLIRVFERAPALYSQDRIGRGGRRFTLMKFRTMWPDGQARLDELLAEDGQARADWECYRKLKRDPRVTPIGRFLRRSSLDELPQLLNILKGDMSVVGPRPILPDERHRFGPLIVLYESTRPGLTGQWQVSGRSNADFATRVKLDTDYVRGWTFGRDVLILAKTLPAVLFSRGAC